MATAADRKADEKRERILTAARSVILRDGLRGATMEAIARQAHMAKPTLYGQFSNKDEVFEAIIESMIGSWSDAFERAFDAPTPLAERMGMALAAKFGTAADMVEGSPHAEELIGAHHRLAHRIEMADDAMTRRMVTALAAEGYHDPEQRIALLLAACSGLLVKIKGGAAVRAAIVDLTARMLASKR